MKCIIIKSQHQCIISLASSVENHRWRYLVTMIRFSIGLDNDIERTYKVMKECMIELNIL